MREISYERAIALLQSTINYALNDHEIEFAKDELSDIGFTDEELCVLGYEEVFFEEEEEEVRLLKESLRNWMEERENRRK